MKIKRSSFYLHIVLNLFGIWVILPVLVLCLVSRDSAGRITVQPGREKAIKRAGSCKTKGQGRVVQKNILEKKIWELATSLDREMEVGLAATPYRDVIIDAAYLNDVDPYLVKAIIMAESDYNPRALSEKGAEGLMQLMPDTARALGVKDSFSPVQNIQAGVRYFRILKKTFNGDIEQALAAYHAGPGAVKKYGGIPPYPETREYIRKVLFLRQIYKDGPSGLMVAQNG